MNISTKKSWIYIKDNGAIHHHGRARFFGGAGVGTDQVYPFNNVGPTIDITGRKMVRTWSLLSERFKAGETSMRLMHSPVRMGWRVGDRIGVAPTTKGSDGTGHAFRITALDDDGTVHIDAPFTGGHFDRSLSFLPPSQAVDEEETRSAALMTAEVVNLSRNIIITGDDLTNDPCDPNQGSETQGCKCTDSRSKCTMGLHTAQMHEGTMSIRNTRIEKCGQRGVTGKYCLHFHMMGDCPTCEFSNNAIEHGHQRGVIVHGTNRSLVENNVIWDVRGAGIYVEDGSEYMNRIMYNVVVCPWSLAQSPFHGCTIPGTNNAESDTPLNQAGIYTVTAANDFIGNRAVNSFNGLLLQAGGCNAHLPFGRWEGNTFHGHSRFGLYTLGGSVPRKSCSAVVDGGLDNGSPVAILNNVDWGTVFVGHYNAGDIQHRGHVSVNNNNLIYWKETKVSCIHTDILHLHKDQSHLTPFSYSYCENQNFADGCAAHISESYYNGGQMALPDQTTIIMERTTFGGWTYLEANHHCNVGVTGMLCTPQYIFHDVQWKAFHAPQYLGLQRGGVGGGPVYSLSPPNAAVVMSGSSLLNSPFPEGIVSLVSSHFTYLSSTRYCQSATYKYSNGIFCSSPLRAIKVWSRGLHKSSAPKLKVEVWVNNTQPEPADVTQMVPFHQIAELGGGKQGYSFPVFILEDVSYHVSLGDAGDNIPGDWIIEFSDTVMGNRWEEEFVTLSVQGRSCSGGIVSSQHSRRYMFGLGFDGAAWGNSGACVDSNPPNKPAVDCNAVAASDKGEW